MYVTVYYVIVEYVDDNDIKNDYVLCDNDNNDDYVLCYYWIWQCQWQ